MSRIPTHILKAGAEPDLTDVRELLNIVVKAANGELDVGYPDDGTGVPTSINVRGAWATATITNVNQLGNGAGAPVTFTHNLDIQADPVAVATGNRCNVTWGSYRVVHGDVTGTNAAPAATANAAHTSWHFKMGDTVAQNSIQLRVHSDIVPTAVAPLVISIFFQPAVQ